MLDRILLIKEQQDLLFTLVEAVRAIPVNRRQKFYYHHVVGNDPRAVIDHEGLSSNKTRAHIGDIEVLSRENLVHLDPKSRHDGSFDVLPAGFKYYELAKRFAGGPVDRVEKTMQNYLSSEVFSTKYSVAYQKWVTAESILWGADSLSQLSTIGHLCREAMQDFASALVGMYSPPGVEPEQSKTVARVRAVIQQKSNQLGKYPKQFLDSLISYWGALNDLIQRQEHGAQKEGRQLVWEDARRVVFQTAVVFFEIDKLLSSIDSPEQ